MSKQYFQHDYNARNNLQIKSLIAEFGAEGYGIFWAIVEVLHEKKNKLPLKEYVYRGIADQINSNAEKVEQVIKFSLEKCELFKEKKGCFSSTRVRSNIIKRLEISKVRAKSGKHGANVKQNLAKERKGKEIKEERVQEPAPANLEGSNLYRKPTIPTRQEVWEVFSRNGGTREMAKAFWDKYEALGWYLNNSPVNKFASLVPGYITNWNRIEKKENGQSESLAPPLKQI